MIVTVRKRRLMVHATRYSVTHRVTPKSQRRVRVYARRYQLEIGVGTRGFACGAFLMPPRPA